MKTGLEIIIVNKIIPFLVFCPHLFISVIYLKFLSTYFIYSKLTYTFINSCKYQFNILNKGMIL